jgi:hypothetical protein
MLHVDGPHVAGRENKGTRAVNIYASLFEGETAPPTAKQQAELDRLTVEAEKALAKMTDEEKAAAWDRIKASK